MFGPVAGVRNLIFISHRIPFPPDRGEKIRGYNLITHLARDYRVYLGCLIDDPADTQHVAHLRSICTEVAAFHIDKRLQKLKALARIRPSRPLMLDYYFHPALRRWVDATAARHPMDVVYIFCTAMAPYALHLACSARILDMQDIDSEKWATYARNSRWPARAIWQREARTLLAYERHAAMQCDLTLLVTQQETRRFAELAPETSDRLTWVQMGVNTDQFSPELDFQTPYHGDGPHLVFTGNMDYWPNADAAAWFAAKVLPLIRDRLAGAQFHIVGANPGPDVLRLAAQPGVHVTGRVPDVRPYVAHAAVSVAPLRMARGVQNKVLEAMALGRPVVTSPQAFEGVRAVPGIDLLVADGAEAMAQAVAEIVAGGHAGLGAAARRCIQQTYTWNATLARLDACLDHVLRAGRGAPFLDEADVSASLARLSESGPACAVPGTPGPRDGAD
jgi:polysaccharide biosynthesis protein PslH